MALAKKAVEVDPDFAQSHSALGLAYAALGRSQESVRAARRAVELQPGDADSHAWLARSLMWAGEGEEACDETQTALRLDPQYVEGPYYNLLARVSFIAGRYEDAIAAYEQNDARGGPQSAERFIIWAAAYGHLGQVEQARSYLEKLRQTHPNFTLAQALVLHGRKSDLEIQRLTEGLRKAGVPQ
jgi:tetratricopeptide (TPR) repeat protein